MTLISLMAWRRISLRNIGPQWMSEIWMSSNVSSPNLIVMVCALKWFHHGGKNRQDTIGIDGCSKYFKKKGM
jgi:hypothetical protein